MWQEKSLTVARVHSYTMSLHERFWRSLSLEAARTLFPAVLAGLEGKDFGLSWMGRTRTSSSLTLALPTGSADSALQVVLALRGLDVVADSRYVRLHICRSFSLVQILYAES
jgi:hypothetical protein